MGILKREMLRRLDVRAQAEEVLVRAGFAHRCEHGNLIDQYALVDNGLAYAIGTKMLQAGEIDADRREFMDAIKQALGALEGMPDTCYECEYEPAKD